MDKERKKRLRTFKIILSDVLIVLSVLGIVTLLSFIAMGYKLNDDGKLDQSGLLQVSTQPTGATVTIDDDNLFMKTNTSHMLSEGTHQVRLTKDGYELWENQVKITAGRLYKLDYPRLFKQDREKKSVKNFGEKGLKFLSLSSDRRSILYQKADSLNWSLINIDSNDAEVVEFDVSKFTGELLGIEWNMDGDKVLTKWKDNDIIVYRLVNLKKPEQSVDLNTEFGMSFSKLRFVSNSGDQLFALENGNLRRVSLVDKEISKVLLASVSDFYNNGPNVVYVYTGEGGKKTVGFYQEGGKSVALRQVEGDNARMFLSEYLGEKYIGILANGKLAIYRGNFPTEMSGLDNMEKILEQEVAVEFSSSEFLEKASGRIMTIGSGSSLLAFDAERGELFSFVLDNEKYTWADDYLVANVSSSGELYLRDFDGTNKRRLAFLVAPYGAVISRNNKWLYYISTSSNGALELIREEI